MLIDCLFDFLFPFIYVNWFPLKMFQGLHVGYATGFAYFSFFLNFLMFCLVEVHYDICKFLTIYQRYHPLHHSPFCSSIPGTVSTSVIFYLHTHIHNICTKSTFPHPFLTSSPLLLVLSPTQRQDVFHPLVFQICKRKKNSIFCLR
jgi:hypothetical protein